MKVVEETKKGASAKIPNDMLGDINGSLFFVINICRRKS